MVLASLLALSACSDADQTSVRLTISADPEVRDRTSEVRLAVVGGHAPATRALDETVALDGREWPLHAVIVPLGGDATRPLDVSLEALDARGRVLARVHAAPAFVPGQSRELALRFEAACLGVLECEPGTTCAGGACAPLPAAAPDAGTPAGDAGARDAGARDAGARDGGARDARAHDAGARETGARDAGARDCGSQHRGRCVCPLGETRECEGGDRVCVPGVQRCLGDRWSECAGRIETRREECNALDDDCDGRVDENLRRECGGDDDCRSRCAGGVWGPCLDDGEACERDD